MPSEYCFIKNRIVETILVCDGEFAESYKAKQGYDNAVPRPANVGVGDLYHDAKFWRLVTADDGTVSEVEL